MYFTVEEILNALGMSAEDARVDEEGEVYIPLEKALALCLEDDAVEDDCACDCEDDCCVPNLVELAQTYGVEILMNERNRAKELGQQEAFDALNFAVDVLLHQNAVDTEWLADTYDNVMG